MSELGPTLLATKGYVTGWGRRLNDSPALRSRHRYDTYYESWLRPTSSIDGSQRTGLETQIAILKRHGCERIFAEEQSGTSTDNRQQLKECLEFMREGDEFTFTMVDRVCRNSYDLQVIVKDLTDRGIME